MHIKPSVFVHGIWAAGLSFRKVISKLRAKQYEVIAAQYGLMGIGMALLEHTTYDRRRGTPINGDLGDYGMAVNAAVPTIDVHFFEFPDRQLNELGVRGIGEIGLAGFAAAVTAAVHRATGVRVRELPIKMEDLA